MEACWVVWTTERGVSREIEMILSNDCVSSREIFELSNSNRDCWGVLGVISYEVVSSGINSIVVCSSEVSTDGMIYLSAQSQFVCNRFDLGLCFLIDFESEVRTFIIMQNNRLEVSNVRNSQRYCLMLSGASAKSTQSLKLKYKENKPIKWSEEDEEHRQKLIKRVERYSETRQKVLSIPGTSVLEDIQYAMTLIYEEYKANTWPDKFEHKYDL
ncbi:hypothetical protein C1646_755069 [Rhizophagus diaphanus]|nr:hypothetical protein C1646_755069 [Rhizophagus diaphanus] [Rhizophagus sp. MUCL 43196]